MSAHHIGDWTKPALDRLMAATLLVFLAPLFLAIGIAIRLEDGSDVFFRQTRVGRGGKVFRIWKFRTMVPDAHTLSGGYFPKGLKLVTRVGHPLRKSSLDEIPQLLNILAGEMSFVGPRPTLPDQVARYTVLQRRRLEVKPGLTGWAQLHGRNNLPWSRRIHYDLEYVDRAGLLFDLWILLRTVPAVLLGSGNHMNQTAENRIDDLGSSAGRCPGDCTVAEAMTRSAAEAVSTPE